MVTLTPRELRIIADHVERLTKARVVNAQLGVDTLPDTVEVDFPNSFTGTVHWTPRRTWNGNAEQAAVARHGRHRDCYQLDPGTLRITGAPRVTRASIDVRAGAEEIRRIVRDTTRPPGAGQNRR